MAVTDVRTADKGLARATSVISHQHPPASLVYLLRSRDPPTYGSDAPPEQCLTTSEICVVRHLARIDRLAIEHIRYRPYLDLR